MPIEKERVVGRSSSAAVSDLGVPLGRRLWPLDRGMCVGYVYDGRC